MSHYPSRFQIVEVLSQAVSECTAQTWLILVNQQTENDPASTWVNDRSLGSIRKKSLALKNSSRLLHNGIGLLSAK
jgi:hypothetical protein